MHKPEFIQEDEIHEFLWDFEMQTDHLIPARRPELVLTNKKKKERHLVDFGVPVDHRIEIKRTIEVLVSENERNI